MFLNFIKPKGISPPKDSVTLLSGLTGRNPPQMFLQAEIAGCFLYFTTFLLPAQPFSFFAQTSPCPLEATSYNPLICA